MAGNRLKPGVFLSCEHASFHVPSKFSSAVDKELLQTHEGFDFGAKELARYLARKLNAPLAMGQLTRQVIDLNRSLSHPKVFGQRLKSGPQALKEAAVDDFYVPYRKACRDQLQSLIKKNGQVIHISVHSFTRTYHGVRRATDIGLLYDPHREPELTLAKAWQNLLKKNLFFKVHRNRPYWGSTDGHVSSLRQQWKESKYVGFELEVCGDLLGQADREKIFSLMADSLKILL